MNRSRWRHGSVPRVYRAIVYREEIGHIEDEHLPGVLRLAAAVVVLSHSEGFGLPALEAWALDR